MWTCSCAALPTTVAYPGTKLQQPRSGCERCLLSGVQLLATGHGVHNYDEFRSSVGCRGSRGSWQVCRAEACIHLLCRAPGGLGCAAVGSGNSAFASSAIVPSLVPLGPGF